MPAPEVRWRLLPTRAQRHAGTQALTHFNAYTEHALFVKSDVVEEEAKGKEGKGDRSKE